MNLSDLAIFGGLAIVWAAFGIAAVGSTPKPTTLRHSTVRYLERTQQSRPSKGFVAIDPDTYVGDAITVLKEV